MTTSRGGGEDDSEVVGARGLREWITGERDRYARVFLVDSGVATSVLVPVVGDDDLLLLPVESEPYDGPARALRYRGELTEIGDELFFGERGVELQDYVAAAYVQIVGPTAVCLLDGPSRRAFLDDAALARRTGVFPSALIDPRVLLAGRDALAAPTELELPSALRVHGDGQVSVGVRGDVVGSIADLPAVLATPLPRAVALGAGESKTEFVAELTSREGIRRYLLATDLMKMLRLVNGTARISGFGWHLIDDDDGRADAEPLAADPFLLETADGLVLADTTTLRRQLLSPVTAQVVAVMQTSSAPGVAAERIARILDLPFSDADDLCREAATRLGIHVGGRVDA
ncbi:hypothetical protein HWD99_11760 [Microbacterium sp. C5A9]|uniref:daptide biosynthesis RiPP recognition protein n=1 Tax=Microbacterium sp. C5A9 TaxID=2736663 RepID=UPI001F51A30D|nr:daptide biosynthesis RiPP recognition protein [Microbacterium sp. C5A9]MCI1019305.1 hypothetical protein [Microbacterium sp. C5A9]